MYRKVSAVRTIFAYLLDSNAVSMPKVSWDTVRLYHDPSASVHLTHFSHQNPRSFDPPVFAQLTRRVDRDHMESTQQHRSLLKLAASSDRKMVEVFGGKNVNLRITQLVKLHDLPRMLMHIETAHLIISQSSDANQMFHALENSLTKTPSLTIQDITFTGVEPETLRRFLHNRRGHLETLTLRENVFLGRSLSAQEFLTAFTPMKGQFPTIVIEKHPTHKPRQLSDFFEEDMVMRILGAGRTPWKLKTRNLTPNFNALIFHVWTWFLKDSDIREPEEEGPEDPTLDDFTEIDLGGDRTGKHTHLDIGDVPLNHYYIPHNFYEELHRRVIDPLDQRGCVDVVVDPPSLCFDGKLRPQQGCRRCVITSLCVMDPPPPKRAKYV